MLAASMLHYVAVASPVLASSIRMLPVFAIVFLVGMILTGLLALVCGVLLAFRIVRPGFLTGWSAAGNLCMAAFVAYFWVQPLISQRVHGKPAPPEYRWLLLIPLCLLIASLVLQGRGFLRQRKARHAGRPS